ncbi:MAG: dihydrolipoyl dehydrogenase [Erysipelotrichaceae bacterium]|nr:dihydrolipoyl dehydrogenase [Erysipelotrichaceae bacterium]
MLEIKAPVLSETTKVARVCVEKDQYVKKDDVLFHLEGMKGNHVIKSSKNGKVTEILMKLNDEVTSNCVLCVVEEEKISGVVEVCCPDFYVTGDMVVTKVCGQDMIREGDTVCEVEILKGSHKIVAPVSGKVQLYVSVKEKLTINQLVATIEPSDVVETVAKEEAGCDVLVIGGGPGGYVAAIYAAQNGKKVTLIEKDSLGGTCLNVGCIPTKALVKSSEVMHEAQHADVFGIEIEKVVPNIKKMMNHKEEVVQTLVNGVEFLMNKNDIHVVRGEASFKDNSTVVVNGEEFKAKDIIIATGSKISQVNIPGIELPFVLDSTKALSYCTLPNSITIIGGGVIGMEFAFMYRNVGVEVYVVEFADRLLSMIDVEASQEILRIAREKGIHVSLQSRVVKIEEHNNKAIVSYEKDQQMHTVETDNVLYAIGRQPNLDNLGLEKTTIALNERGRGVHVDEYMKTNVDHIYAIGDVTNIIQLAHVASEQGIVAVDNILGKKVKMHYHAVPNVIFTDPEIACVGLLEQELDDKANYTISKFNFTGNGKALTMNKNIGFVKLIMENASKKVVGGTIIGPDASSLINALTIAIQNELTVEAITQTIFPHPTTGEAIHEAALGLGLGSIHG